MVECAKVRHATLYKAAGEVLAAALKATSLDALLRKCKDTIEDVTDTSKAGSHHRHGRFASLVSVYAGRAYFFIEKTRFTQLSESGGDRP